MMEDKNQSLYLAQFIASLGVVMIHVGRILPYTISNFILQSLICRIAVPFFFINNAFFFRLKSHSRDFERKWLKKMLLLYSGIFLIYLPFGINLLQQTYHVKVIYLPLALIVAFFYIGSFYHLWYFPALIFSLFFVKKLLEKFSFRVVFFICCTLFILGSFETYTYWLANPTLKNIFNFYLKTFFTTRNGLFFSPLFILLGYYLADHKQIILTRKKPLFMGITIAGIIAILEGFLLIHHPGKDKNFLFFSISFAFCLFGLLLIYPASQKDFSKLKDYSQGIFLFHLRL